MLQAILSRETKNRGKKSALKKTMNKINSVHKFKFGKTTKQTMITAILKNLKKTIKKL